MSIGIALVLIFVLYLIDKHKRWRQAFKLTVGLVVLGIVSVGGFFGWQKYEALQEARQEARQEAEYEAEQAKQAAQKQAELAKTCKDWEDKHPIGSPLDRLHGKQDDGTTIPEPGLILNPPQGCEGPLETDYSNNEAAWVASNNPSKPKPAKLKTETQPQSQPNCQVVVCSDWAVVVADFGRPIRPRCFFDEGLFPCGTTTTDIAELRKGDRVQILSDKIPPASGADIYEVKFQQWTGWLEASALGPEKRQEK